MSKYKTPQAFLKAYKDTARNAGLNIDRCMQSLPLERFLARVFSEPQPAFVLKGGQSMLVRTNLARGTRDIDLMTLSAPIEESIDELMRISSIDLGDFFKFEYVNCREIRVEDEYREGYRISFKSRCSTKQLSDVIVDLVSDEVFQDEPVIMKPSASVQLDGIEVPEYWIYPIQHVIADKVCAIMETHGQGKRSSRVKDLVDLVIIACTQCVDGDKAVMQLAFEARVRGIGVIDSLHIPEEWNRIGVGTYSKEVESTGLGSDLKNFESGLGLAKRLVDPIASGIARNSEWNCLGRQWMRKS